MTTSIRNQRLSATSALFAATAIAVPEPWLTSGTTPAQSAETSTASRHCVRSLSNASKQVACYDSFTAAIFAATGGRITDAPADAGTAMKDQGFLEKLRPTGEKKTEDVQPARSERVISILFSDVNFEGSTLVYTTDRDCTTLDIDFADPYVGDPWPEWNDEADSVKTFANCRARFWEHRDFKGRGISFWGDRTDFGILADEVSSIEWS